MSNLAFCDDLYSGPILIKEMKELNLFDDIPYKYVKPFLEMNDNEDINIQIREQFLGDNLHKATFTFTSWLNSRVCKDNEVVLTYMTDSKLFKQVQDILEDMGDDDE